MSASIGARNPPTAAWIGSGIALSRWTPPESVGSAARTGRNGGGCGAPRSTLNGSGVRFGIGEGGGTRRKELCLDLEHRKTKTFQMKGPFGTQGRKNIAIGKTKELRWYAFEIL
jgi:hypothetical protein